MALSKNDVQRLMTDASIEARQEVLAKVAQEYNGLDGRPLSEDEAKLIEDIFRALAHSTEVEIRKTLAENIKNSPNLPKDIALKMASDIADVANPILQYSQVLDDNDLMNVLATTKDVERILAIAKRDNLSETLTTTLLDKNDNTISTTVLNSFGSKISDASYNKIIESQSVNENIVSAILEKGSLSVSVTDKLLKSVSSQIRESLDSKYHVIFENKQLKKEMEKNLELATASIMGQRSANAQHKKLREELHASGKLVPLMALSSCNYQMFEITLSRLARVPLNNLRILLYEHGALGLERLCKKAELPDNLFGVIDITVRALQSFEAEFVEKHRAVIKPKELVQRIKLLAGDKQIDHLDFFISLMKPEQR